MNNLKPGDRVMLVWGCCPSLRREIGSWTTEIVNLQRGVGKCYVCGASGDYTHGILANYRTLPVQWLIKMPPDSEVKRELEELVVRP